MRNLYLQARYWTYSMMYGPSHLMPPFTLNHTSGSGFVERFWGPLSTWLKKNSPTKFLSELLVQMTQSSSQSYEKVIHRYRHIGRHRGEGRQTRSGIRRMREQRYDSLENRRVYQELMADPSTRTEPIVHVPGSRAYRRLAWSRLTAEAIRLRAKHYPEDKYEQVP
jgi:hypothetical protein